MNRVSFNRLVADARDYTAMNSSKLMELQRQLSTGKKISEASDDPDVAIRTRRFEARIRRDEQAIRNIENSYQAVNEAETHMKSAIEQLQRIRTLTLQASNDSLVTADRVLIATEINQQLEGLLRTANTRSLGNSVFAGAEIDRDAFVATRDGNGEIVSVAYQGDDVELRIDARGEVPVTWPGDRVFSSGPQVRKSTLGTFDGSTAASYPDREISASYLPSSGLVEGSIRINGVLVNYDLDGNPTTGEGDSLLDLARSINAAGAGVKATVTGSIQGTVGVPLPAADFGTISGGLFTGGSFSLNGASITVNDSDNIFTLANRINAEQSRTGVTAEIYDANGNRIDGNPDLSGAASPVFLRLNGGWEFSNGSPGIENVAPIAGFLARTLTTVVEDYAIRLEGDTPGPFTIEDATGSLAGDLGLTSSSGVTSGGDIFSLLVNLRDSLRRGSASDVNNTISEIDGALESVEVYRTETGVRSELLEERKTRLEAVVLNNKELLSDISEVDLAEVITELRNQQNAQTAALKAVSSVLGLSLLNYL